MATRPAYKYMPSSWHEATPRWALKTRMHAFNVFFTGLRWSTTVWPVWVFAFLMDQMASLDRRFKTWIDRGMDARRKKVGELTSSCAEEEHLETDQSTEPEVSHPEIKGKGDDAQESTPEEDDQRSTVESDQEDDDTIVWDAADTAKEVNDGEGAKAQGSSSDKTGE